MRSKIGRETRFDARGLFAAAMCGWLAASCSPTKFEEYRFQPGVQIESSGALTTTEAGGEATFTVRLQSAPKRPVVVDVASSDSGEGVVDPPQLMFGPDDWETPKTVRIRGVDDGVGDGDQAFTISFVVVSEDHAYEGLAVDPLHALNREVPSVVVGDPTPLFRLS